MRLFGVNLECQMDEDDGDDSVATAAAAECPRHDSYYGQNMYNYYTPQPHNMVINFNISTLCIYIYLFQVGYITSSLIL